jgi:aspartate/methionine/tyrosine aminotransferase
MDAAARGWFLALMDLPLSPRIRATGAPPIPAVRGWAARYQGGAGPVLDLTQAVPGYPPHPELLSRLGAAAGDAKSAGYGPIEGEGALREALAADMARAYAGRVNTADIAITAGGNLAFTLAMMTLAGAGEAVMLPAPWYFNHRMTLEALGIPCRVLPCRAEDGFLPDPALAATLMQGVRAVVLVTPNNPTGATYSPELIAQFAKLCRDHGAWLVLDETYRDFIPEAAGAPHGLFQDAAWRDHVVHLYSFSKAYCVPGHRVGAIAAGQGFQRELAKAIDTVQICPPRAPQIALSWGVEALRDWRAGNRAIMAERAACFRAAMAPLNAWRIDALGTYFAYLRLPDGAGDSEATAESLAVERGLLGLPGSFFGPGQERHLRLAFANAEEAVIASVPGRLA